MAVGFVAAIVVVLRVIVERAGAPISVSNVLGGAVLITVLGPIYFAREIGMASLVIGGGSGLPFSPETHG